MKKNILIILITVFGFTSCEDFLNLNPRSQANANSFYSNENEFDQALNGTYNQLRSTISTTTGWLMGEMRSDNTHYDYKPSDRALANVYRENVADFMDDAANTQTSPKWNNGYIVISRANAILDNIEGATFNEASKNRIAGEALFLRALSYYDLVRFYGNIPLFVHAVNNQDETFLGQSPASEIYSQIISDLQAAVQKLSAPVFPQSGRATKGSALTLLADVYMTQKKYSEAEALLKQVTQMGYELLPDYGSIYALSNKNSKESIFEVQYSIAITGQEGNFPYWFLPRMSNTTIITGVNTNTITDRGGYNTPTQDLIDSYEPGDTRLDASIAIAEGTFNNSSDFTATAVKSIDGYTAPAGKVGRPFIRKYIHAHSLPNKTDDNWPVYRYSEVLLFLAESLNEQGKSAEALPYLNQVRTRAKLPVVTNTNQAQLREIIMHERRIELAFENKRWLDLVRTGKAIEVMTAYGNKMKQTHTYLLPGSYQVTANRLLFPIPYAELQYNTNLVQNSGY